MAIIANIAAGYMFRVFAGRTASVMTQGAFKRCALENTGDVATGTVQKLVLAGQRESGGEMVKAFHVISGMWE